MSNEHVSKMADALMAWTVEHESDIEVRQAAMTGLIPRAAYEVNSLTADWKYTFGIAQLVLGFVEQPCPPIFSEARGLRDWEIGAELRAEIRRRLGDVRTPNPAEYSPDQVPALFFDSTGCGPDSLLMSVDAFDLGRDLDNGRSMVSIGVIANWSPFGMHTNGGYALDIPAAKLFVERLNAAIAKAEGLAAPAPEAT